MRSQIHLLVQDLSAICRWAAEALGISSGEFWVWYGSPFILAPGGCQQSGPQIPKTQQEEGAVIYEQSYRTAA